MLLSVHRIGVSAERHTENLAAQILQRSGKPGLILILPRSQMIGFNGTSIRHPECDRSDLTALFRNKILNSGSGYKPSLRIVGIGPGNKIRHNKHLLFQFFIVYPKQEK